jgi:hypothetical protein
LLTSTLPLSGWAQFTFITNDDNTITITGYTGSDNNVVIPASTNGYSVTGIAFEAFFGFTWVTSVTIPNGVDNIDSQAFAWCSGMTNVVIPNSVTNLGDWAFYDCSSLTNLVIPNGVVSLGSKVFYQCSSLSSVTIPDSVVRMGDNNFSFCSRLASVTIGSGVTNIGVAQFGACLNLTNIAVAAANPRYASVSRILFNKTLTELVECPAGFVGNYDVPNGVIFIDDSAFYYCTSLSSVTIPDSVINIGFNGFYICSALTNVTIGNSVTNIGGSAFRYCTNLRQTFFRGNAPLANGQAGSSDTLIFNGETGKVYRLPGTTGWSSTFGGWSTALWYQSQPQILGSSDGLGVQSNKFQFTVSWATNTSVVIEGSTNLHDWTPVVTNALASGTNRFSDSTWTNYPQQFYRVRSQ